MTSKIGDAESQNMSLRLHWSPDSANLVIRIALEVFAIPYESVRLNRGKGDHKTKAYLAKNPQGLIPVLEDGDLTLFETGAILWHLAERSGCLGLRAPSIHDPVTRAAGLKWIFYVANTVHADLRVAFYADRYVGTDDIAGLRRGIAQRMRGHCDLIEAQLVRGGLLGANVTLADIYLAICLRWAQLYPSGEPLLVDLSEWPRLLQLCAQVEGSEGAKRAFAAEFIQGARPITQPLAPDLPTAEIVGTV